LLLSAASLPAVGLGQAIVAGQANLLEVASSRRSKSRRLYVEWLKNVVFALRLISALLSCCCASAIPRIESPIPVVLRADASSR
jgi:hypothetical protein